MTTTTYKNLRALTQLLSVLIILVSIPLPIILFMNNRLTTLEVDNLKLGYLSLTFLYKVLIIFNITLGMFASCGMNSKVKLYMRFYLFTSFIYMMVLIGYILYVQKGYQDYLVTSYVEKSTLSVQQRVIMSSLLYCSPSMNCEGLLRQKSELSIKSFLFVAVISFILHLMSFVLIKVTVNIPIEKPVAKIPSFMTITRAGMDTQSLRVKRVMDIETVPHTPETVSVQQN